MTDVKDADELKSLAREVTGQVWPRWRRWVEWDDVNQHLWVWMMTHGPTMETLEPEYVLRRMRTAAERYCRREKAQRCGYDPVDEYFYTWNRLLKILPDAFDPEATPPVETFRADELYGEWVTEVSDVRAALRKKTFPLRHYGVLREFTEGRRKENDQEVRDALWALQRQLGGTRPK